MLEGTASTMIFLQNKITRLLPAFLLAGFFSHSQVLIKTSVEKDKILVGEPVKVTVEARMPLGQTLSWFMLDTIPHFEWMDKGMPVETDGIDGKIVQHSFTIIGYDTGYWTIPQFTIKVVNKNYTTDTVGLRVDYEPGFNPEENYRDIKETEEVTIENENKLEWLYYAGAGLILLLLLYLLFRNKSAKEAAKNIVPLTPFNEALQSLAALRNEKPAAAEEVKLFYTKLNDILRNFLAKQFRIPALEETNDEVIVQLRQFSIPAEQFSKTTEALRIADFVKFARYLPAQADNERALSVIESAIHSLNKPSTQGDL